MTLTFSPPAQPETHSVLVLQRILPPYRLGFFQALARSPKIRLTLAYGSASEASALESVVNPPGLETVPLKNVYLGENEKIIVQRGSLRLIGSNHCDTVIAEFNPRILTNVLACLLAPRRRVKFIFWGHGFRPKSGPMDKRIYLWLAKRADAMIFYTPDGAAGLAEQGMPLEKAFIAWNSIDTEEIARLAQDFEPEQRFRVLCIGRLIAEKKVDLLIRGFAEALPGLKPGTTLTVIGDGPQKAVLEALAHELGAPVEFVPGLYDQERLAPYFNTSSLSVSAGYVGLSAVHSLAYGVPMIVADNEPHSPEIAAIEDGVNAVFFRAGDAAALAARLRELLDLPDRLRQMSRAAQTGTLRDFSLGAMVQAFEQAVQYAHKAGR